MRFVSGHRRLLAAAVAGSLLGAGCAPTETSSPPSTAPVSSVIVAPSADNLLVGDSQQLIALMKDGRDR